MLTKEERKNLIINNIDLVKKIALMYSKETNISASELESYGYEGLIDVVDKFNNLDRNTFIQYMHRYIRRHIEEGIRILSPEYYYKNIAVIKPELLTSNLKNKINLNNTESLSSYEDSLITEGDIFYEVSQDFIKTELYKLVNILKPV